MRDLLRFSLPLQEASPTIAAKAICMMARNFERNVWSRFSFG